MVHRIGYPLRPAAILFAVAAFVLAALVAPSPSHARIIERLDFETGNLRQWDGIQALPGRVRIIRWPRRQGRFAARFTVRPGDNPINAPTGFRAELAETTYENEGTESWWRWSTRFPRGFVPIMGTWNVFTQWHHTGPICQPNVAFHVERTPHRSFVAVTVRGGPLNTANCAAGSQRHWRLWGLRRGVWYTIVFHVRWSLDPRVGFVEVWVNGRKRVPKTYMQTLYPGQGVYVKQGFTRGPSPLTHVVYHDGLVRYTR